MINALLCCFCSKYSRERKESNYTVILADPLFASFTASTCNFPAKKKKKSHPMHNWLKKYKYMYHVTESMNSCVDNVLTAGNRSPIEFVGWVYFVTDDITLNWSTDDPISCFWCPEAVGQVLAAVALWAQVVTWAQTDVFFPELCEKFILKTKSCVTAPAHSCQLKNETRCIFGFHTL